VNIDHQQPPFLMLGRGKFDLQFLVLQFFTGTVDQEDAMLTQADVKKWQSQAVEYLQKARIVITPSEKDRIEIADFGLDQFTQIGLAILVYVNTDRVCAKELVMLPHQTCPEHRHPTLGRKTGKEETFRCRWGKVYLYVPGKASPELHSILPEGSGASFTVFKEIVLQPGVQYTLMPNTLHWFQAGSEGAVVSEFSTTSTDDADVFTDPAINRITKIVG
jgi:D-lyxose ketol-isomerase